MNKNKYIVIAILFCLFNYACEKVGEPTGFIGAEDKEPPLIKLIEPVDSQNVKGYFIVKIIVKELFGINKIIFKANEDNLRNEFIAKSGDTLIYKLDAVFLNGIKAFSVEVYDESNNKSISHSVNINITPVIKTELSYSTTNNNRVFDIKEDKAGNIWFGMQNGLFQYSNGIFIKNPQGFNLPRPSISAIAIDSKNNKWMVYKENYNSEDHKLICYDGSSVTKKYYIPRSSYPYYISNLEFDAQDTLWGTYDMDGYFTFRDNIWNLVSIFPDRCYSLIKDINNRIWISTESGVKYNFAGVWIDTNFPEQILGKLYTDFSGNIWFHNNYSPDKLFKYSGSSWNSTTFCEIKAVTFDKNGFIWIANHGLEKYNQEGTLLQKYYFFNPPNSLFCDSNNNIWIFDEWGIHRLNEDGISN